VVQGPTTQSIVYVKLKQEPSCLVGSLVASIGVTNEDENLAALYKIYFAA